MNKTAILHGVTPDMPLAEKHDLMCRNAGITAKQLDEMLAIEIGLMYDAMATENGESPGTYGVSGSDIAGLLADTTDETLAELIAAHLGDTKS